MAFSQYSMIITARQRSWQGCRHVTITQDALELTVQGAYALALAPPPPPDIRPSDMESLSTNPALQTSDMGPLQSQLPLLVTSSGHHWRPVQTCSFEEPPPSVLTCGDQSSYS